MKKLIIGLVFVLFVFVSNAQIKLKNGDKPLVDVEYVLNSNGILRDKPIFYGNELVSVPKGDTIRVVQIMDIGYLKVKTKSGSEGFMNEVFLFNPDYEYMTHSNYVLNYSDPRNIDKKIYGNPNQQTEYNSDNYNSQSFVWYCANGYYRKIDYVYNNGEWKRESEFKSDCIK